MNKTLLRVSLLVLGLGLVACGSSTSETMSRPVGKGGAAGAAGHAGAAGMAGMAGSTGQGGSAGTAGAAGSGGAPKVDADGDGYDQSVDCDDNNNKVHPDAPEVCNGLDDNCNGQIDESMTGTYYVDQDGDGYGVDDPATNMQSCSGQLGYSTVAGDCDDANKEANPGKTEECNGFDDNCDGQVDETGQKVFYVDADGDGYGVDDPNTNFTGCSAPSGYAPQAGDCDDTNPGANPGAAEVNGNAVDENCDLVVEPCPIGWWECAGNVARECDMSGMWKTPQDCGSLICSDLYGCVVCVPGTASCNGGTSHSCNGDGMGYTDFVCDPDLGSACDANTGKCTGPCAAQTLGKSYIGCEYYASVTMNSLLGAGFDFAVAVSNTKPLPATIKVYQGATLVTQTTTAADSVSVIVLPWNTLKSSVSSAKFTGLAYHIKSTQPVTVYQFNPLQYMKNGSYTYTNDASLLLPVTAWGKSYIVASRNTWSSYPGFYAVVASQDGTTVTAQPGPTGTAIVAGAGILANGTGTMTLNAGDVVQIASGSSTASDLTGTILTANKPVEVFGGHNCTFVPSSTGYCDHLEEAMFPIPTLSKDYIVSAPSVPGSTPGANFTRVIATEAGTSLTYDPAVGGGASIAQAGAYIEINNSTAFRVTADKKVLVSQYMQGNGSSSVPGDPAMALAVATAQYRKDYLFHAPTNYANNYVNVIALAGSTVTLDGAAVAGWTTIGATGYSVARVALPNSNAGNHRITSDQPAGITVYGYGTDTSYWYPGGLNLNDM